VSKQHPYTAKRADDAYTAYNWNDGDRGSDVVCHSQWIARNAKTQPCAGNGAGMGHEVEAGERMLVQKALVDGSWCGYRLCLECCDKWLDELEGIDRAESQEEA